MSKSVTDTQMTGVEEDRIRLPGFGLPIQHLPDWNKRHEKWERFPHAIADALASEGVTVREMRMLDFMGQITDKPEWDRKVFDEEIVAKWHDESCKYHESLEDVYMSEQMFEFCISELREKAERFKETNVIAVLDAEATIVKSDTMVPADLLDALKRGVSSLEDIPEHLKDWHPRSDDTVLDLVHPSLYPLIYGKSMALLNGHVPLKDCASYSGKGERLDDTPTGDGKYHELTLNGWGNSANLKAWGSYQWLPTDVKFREDGTAFIDSYINNLHPVRHAELYPVLERFVDCSIPLWNEALSWFHSRIRIHVDSSSDEDYYIPEGVKYEGEGADEHSDGSEFWDYDDDYRDWKEQVRVLTQREPRDFKTFETVVKSKPSGARPVDLRKKFADSGLQVIFKLANIHLTPEKPKYNGGHVEGALNEHICATALYYYDQENIEDSYLSFRQSIDTEGMTEKPAQSEYSSLEDYYGVQQESPALQDLGKVLTREGRMLAFPNVLQHSVHGFSLRDQTKPGHRKILAMFLVDPHIRVLSTTNVPPQQKDWWKEGVRKVEPLAALPQEIFDKIIEEVQDFPLDYKAACDAREELMKERSEMNTSIDAAWEMETFFFCEH